MKLNLLKKILITSPIVIAPLLASSCGSKGPTYNATKQFYMKELAIRLQQALHSSAFVQIVNTARAKQGSSATSYTANVTSLFTTAYEKAKKDASIATNRPTDYNPNNFSNIIIKFQSSIMKLVKENDEWILTVYPSFIEIGNFTDQRADQLNLTLEYQKEFYQDNANLVFKYNIRPGFRYFPFKNLENGENVNASYTSSDSTLVILATNEHFDIGIWNTKTSEYQFTEHNNPNSNIENDNYFTSVTASVNKQTIFVGTKSGYIGTGTLQDNKYKFIWSDIAGSASASDNYYVYLNWGHDGNLYASVSTKGILVADVSKDNLKFKTIWEATNLITTCATADSAGNVYVGTRNAGLYKGIADKTFSPINDPAVTNTRILSLSLDSKNNLLVGLTNTGGNKTGLAFGKFEGTNSFSWTSYPKNFSGVESGYQVISSFNSAGEESLYIAGGDNFSVGFFNALTQRFDFYRYSISNYKPTSTVFWKYGGDDLKLANLDTGVIKIYSLSLSTYEKNSFLYAVCAQGIFVSTTGWNV